MKKVIICIILVGLGLIVSLIYYGETNLTSLLAYHDKGVYTVYVSGPLTAGQSVHGEFQAAYDNLGVVKLRVITFNRINTTHVRFKIREKGKSETWATNQYTTDRFTDGLLYPFGFPVIWDSKGKTYEYSLESLDGTSDNAIGISSGYHDTATQYVSQTSNLRFFVTEKAVRSVSDPYMILYLTMFLIPAVIYLFPRYAELLTGYALLVYMYLPISMHSNTILVMAAVVLGIALFVRAKASRIYLTALLLISQIPFMIAFGNVLAATRAATLIFFLILTGGIISLKELREK